MSDVNVCFSLAIASIAIARFLYGRWKANEIYPVKPLQRPERSYIPSKTSAPGKLNIFVSDSPPPGSIGFHPDGKITQTPSSPQAQAQWTVMKMTRKIEQEPHDGEWYQLRGEALMVLGRYAEAIPDFDVLIRMYAGWGGYHRCRGICYYHAGDSVHALEDLRLYREVWKADLDPAAVKILETLEKSSNSGL